jgi:hypothetical protein
MLHLAIRTIYLMRLIFIFLSFFFGLTANAQKKLVFNGTITDSKTNEPLENVSVVISDVKKNTGLATSTGFGIYSFDPATIRKNSACKYTRRPECFGGVSVRKEI